MTEETHEWPEPGTTWQHVKTEKLYAVVGRLKVEAPDESWQDHVLYMPLGAGLDRFSRSLDRFMARFTPVRDARDAAKFEEMHDRLMKRRAENGGTPWPVHTGDGP